MSGRPNRPWKQKGRKNYYISINGRRINLGPDRAGAFRRYHELMAKPPRRGEPQPKGVRLIALVDEFLLWCEHEDSISPATHEWYRQRLALFSQSIPTGMLAGELKPFHVQSWLNDYSHLSSGTRRNYCRAVKRLMSWAVEQGIVERSPIARLKKPAGGRRDLVITSEEYARLLSSIRDREFRDLVETAWETGARAEEILTVEARHVDREGSRWIFPASESKGKRRVRLVYLNAKAHAITKRLAFQHQEGRLFRNMQGRAWTTDCVHNRFDRLKENLGKKFCLTNFRHTWATRALERGVDPITVSTLMGHVDTNTLAKHYAHVYQNSVHLHAALRKISG